MRWAILLAVVVPACSGSRSGGSVPADDGGSIASPVAAPPVAPDPSGPTAATCPPVSVVAAHPAAPGRRIALRLASVAKDGNRVLSYRMDSVAAAPTGARWAGAGFDGAVVWNGATREREISAASTVHEIAFASDGRTLLVGTQRVDLTTGTVTPLPEVRPSLEHSSMNEIVSMAWAPDGRYLVASAQHRPSRCCRDRTSSSPRPQDRLLVLDGTTGALVHELSRLGLSTRVAVSATHIAATTMEGATVWDRATFTGTTRAGFHGRPEVFHPAGTWLATTERGEVTLWRMPAFCPTARFTVDARFVHAVAFHPTLPVVFVAGTDHRIRAFATDAAGEELASVAIPDPSDTADQSVDSMVVTADGRFLVVPVYMEDHVAFFEVAP